MSIFSSIGALLHKGIDGLKTVSKVVFAFGDDLVNKVKAIEATPIGSEIVSAVETIAGAVIPATYLNAFKTFLPTLIKDLGWVQAELNKSDDEIIADFVNWFKGITNPDAKASVAHVLNANVSKFVSDQSGAGVTIQQALTLPQIIHNPTIFDTVAPDLTKTVAGAPASEPVSELQGLQSATSVPPMGIAGQQAVPQ